jgi:choline-sulfatase
LYTTYDREIAARAQVWLREEAGRHTAKPWIMFLSFVCPHFPLTAPPEYFYRLLRTGSAVAKTLRA